VGAKEVIVGFPEPDPEFTVMVNESFALWPAGSVTSRVKVSLDALVPVVPEITPALVPEGVIVSPLGSCPEYTENV
jgi:hypothetical protein